MAYSYVALVYSGRAQLFLLSSHSLTTGYRVATTTLKHLYYFHGPLFTSMSTLNTGSEYLPPEKPVRSDESKTIIDTDQPINYNNVQTTELYDEYNVRDFHSVADRRIRQNCSVKRALTNSRKNSQIASQYFKQSWSNHFKSNIKADKDSETDDSQIYSQSKERAAGNAERQRNTFGKLSMEIGVKKEQTDWRNPNERINEEFPEDIDVKRDPRMDIPLSRYGRKNWKSYYYTRKISIKGREGKIKEALAIFEHWMMVRDRVMPSKRTFVALIGILGRVGYTEKAFELFSKMKQLGLDPVDHIYTSLFNACANSPSVNEALSRTEYLLNHMKEKGVPPNLFTVKAAMKALAFSGDFSRAFALLDEASAHLKLDSQCFSHLLMASISDKEAGFKRAIQVWQKMKQFGIRPDLHMFNLLIRSARDCGVGDLRTFCSALDMDLLGIDNGHYLLENVKPNFDIHKPSSLPKPIVQTDDIQPCDAALQVIGKKCNIHSAPISECGSELLPHKSVSKITVTEQELALNRRVSHQNNIGPTTELFNNPTENVTELCNENSSLSNLRQSTSVAESNETKTPDIVNSLYTELLTKDNGDHLNVSANQMSFKDLRLASGRLAFLGGATKIVSYMEALRAPPDIKTYTQLLACLPNNEGNEYELLRMMEKSGMKPDIDFLNDIMMRRSLRKEGHTAQAVLKIMSKLRLAPNMRTYAALALTCSKEKDAHTLLEDMKKANVEPNSVIMGHLIYISHSNFTYKLKMLKVMETLGLKVTKENLATIEKSIAFTKKKIIEAESKKDTANFYLSEHFQRSFHHFMRYYKIWLTRTELYKPCHPWNSFKSSSDLKQKTEEVKTT